MSIFFSSDSHIPTNVVEVGNEISQNSLNALTAAYPPITASNPVATAANVTVLMTAPSVAGSGSGYNQQYDINGNAFYFSTNFYPIELTFTATNGQPCVVPARYASCPVAGTVLSSTSINYGNIGSQVYGFGGQGQDNGQPMYQFTQSEGSIANGDCTTASTGGWPAADQDIGCDQYGSATTFWFSGENWTWRTDGNGGGQWYQLSEPPSGCSGDTGNTSQRSATIYINELGGDYTAGYYNTKEVYNSDCSTYWEDTDGPHWYGYGTYITSNGDYNYLSDGTGSYYSEYTGGGGGSTECSGNTGNTSTRPVTIYINNLGGDYAIGYYNTYESYNSDCTTYWQDMDGPWWFENGTVVAGQGDYTYHSDGAGSYYEQYNGTGGGDPYTEGTPTGNTSSRNADVYFAEFGTDVTVGSYETTEYYHADGSTYYADSGGPFWYPQGNYVGTDPNSVDWYSDGNGGIQNTP